MAACSPVVHQVDLIEGNHANFEVGDVLFRGMLLVGDSTDADRAQLAGTILNEGPAADVLQSVSLGPAASAVTVRTNVELQPDVPVRVGPTGSVQIVLSDAGDVYRAGEFVPLTLRLRHAGQASHQVIVESAQQYLEPLGGPGGATPLPIPTPTPSRPPVSA
jgi:hypothetical protein